MSAESEISPQDIKLQQVKDTQSLYDSHSVTEAHISMLELLRENIKSIFKTGHHTKLGFLVRALRCSFGAHSRSLTVCLNGESLKMKVYSWQACRLGKLFV